MSNVIPFQRPASTQRADGVMAAVNIAARRLGYSDAIAYRVARAAKKRYVDGKASAAAVVSQVKAELQQNAEQVPA